MMRVAGKYVFFSTSLILVILHLSVWIQDNHAFSVKRVLISGTELLETDEVLLAARVDTATSLWDTDVTQIEERIRALPQVQDVEIVRTFPSSLRISIAERRPVALLVNNGIWGLDAEGWLLPKLRPAMGLDYPIIVGLSVEKHIPGARVDNPRIVRLAAFLGVLRKSNPFIYHLLSEVSLNESIGVKALSTERNLPIFFGKKNLLKNAAKLAAAWQYLTAGRKLKDVLYLDLRFEGQVIAKTKV